VLIRCSETSTLSNNSRGFGTGQSAGRVPAFKGLEGWRGLHGALQATDLDEAFAIVEAFRDRVRIATTTPGERYDVNDRCSMGFAELFQLAKGRAWTEEEVREFQSLDQQGRSRMVKQLAAEAGCVRTEDRIGTDGVVYTAFWRE